MRKKIVVFLVAVSIILSTTIIAFASQPGFFINPPAWDNSIDTVFDCWDALVAAFDICPASMPRYEMFYCSEMFPISIRMSPEEVIRGEIQFLTYPDDGCDTPESRMSTWFFRLTENLYTPNSSFNPPRSQWFFIDMGNGEAWTGTLFLIDFWHGGFLVNEWCQTIHRWTAFYEGHLTLTWLW